ncbi:MAG TPA: hypothetical protein VFC38_05675 [Stellaceae bacterium]|nr:hypothetical protein [Stellaceae bacterium]
MQVFASAHRSGLVSRVAHLAGSTAPVAAKAVQTAKRFSLNSILRQSRVQVSRGHAVPSAREVYVAAEDHGWQRAMRSAIPKLFSDPRAIRSAVSVPSSIRLATMTGRWTAEAIAESWDYALRRSP